MQETWVQSLGGEDPLEKGLPPHSKILVWEVPLTEEPGGLQFMVLQKVRPGWVTNNFHLSFPPGHKGEQGAAWAE